MPCPGRAYYYTLPAAVCAIQWFRHEKVPRVSRGLEVLWGGRENFEQNETTCLDHNVFPKIVIMRQNYDKGGGRYK